MKKIADKIDDKRLLELAKLYGDNYAYGQIINSIKEDIIKKLEQNKNDEIQYWKERDDEWQKLCTGQRQQLKEYGRKKIK